MDWVGDNVHSIGSGTLLAVGAIDDKPWARDGNYYWAVASG